MILHSFESDYKKFSLLKIDQKNFKELNDIKYKAYIRIIYLPAGCKLSVDFKQFTTKKNSLFFVNYNQQCHIEKFGKESGIFLYYNRDFYCVQIHDAEVACDGLLFNNIFGIPMSSLSQKDDAIIRELLKNISEELSLTESSREEMIRTYLKQMIIRATRLWKQQQIAEINNAPDKGLEFFRNFSRLVEIHFREKHNVADYADMLAIAPKTLSKKFNQLGLANPNEFIKNRICLEAKRLLIYTDLSVKEIAYDLSYDDPAYFNRLFTTKMKYTPAAFRKQFMTEDTRVVS